MYLVTAAAYLISIDSEILRMGQYSIPVCLLHVVIVRLGPGAAAHHELDGGDGKGHRMQDLQGIVGGIVPSVIFVKFSLLADCGKLSVLFMTVHAYCFQTYPRTGHRLKRETRR